MTHSNNRAFTIIELLVVVSIIALLVGILLPAIGKARDQAKVTISQANLRNIGTAHQSYAAEWADRQLTFVDDNISTYGSGTADAYQEYQAAHGGPLGEPRDDPTQHPPVYLGWGWVPDEGISRMLAYRCTHAANNGLTLPINFVGFNRYFGSFRLQNAKQFSEYVSGKFYDKTFYAPKDKVVVDFIGECWESPDDFCALIMEDMETSLGDIPAWSSYVMSPSAMINPQCMSHNDPQDDTADGFIDPWSLGAGWRSPGYSQCQYPSLKTHVLEHHWLQNAQTDCNPTFDPGTYAGCEPYYFNHAWESSPVTLFYDGHVEGVGVRSAMRADGRMQAQTGEQDWGLWSRDTLLDEVGYYIDAGYDQAATSFHVLTTNGIRGRDVTAN